jgi:Flp pilus assembly protein TadG
MTHSLRTSQNQPARPRCGNDRGFVSIISAVVLLGMVPILGLSIDASAAYVIRASLSAALDAAALAAARSLNLGASVSVAQTAAAASATTFFNANFPVGYMGTDSSRTLTPTFTLKTDSNGRANGILEVKVTGTVNAPTYFAKILNVPNIPITAVGSATRKNLVMTIVLDQSASMGSRNSSVGSMPSSIDSTSSSCEAMVYSANQFLSYFTPYDTVGVVTFDYTAHNAYAPSTNFKASGGSGAGQQIANIQCGNNTNTTAALELAYRQIQSVNTPLAQNVIVLFTDGVPNGVTANFPVRFKTDTRLGPSGPTPVPADGNCSNTNGTTMCTNMPIACATNLGNNVSVYGVISQTAGFSVNSGGRGGLYPPFDNDSSSTFPNGCPQSGITMVNQTIAYIPDSDAFGNSMHGNWDNWIYQVNNHCAPNTTQITSGNSACKNLGDLWSNYPTIGTNTVISGSPSNFFPNGTNYANRFRPDLVNTIGVTSMNSAANEAARIRSDTTYNPTIHTIYLQGNGSDPVDRSFLQIVANQPFIQPIIYDPTAAAYVNPSYQVGQHQGMWLPTASALQLQQLFAQLASSLLRISQ